VGVLTGDLGGISEVAHGAAIDAIPDDKKQRVVDRTVIPLLVVGGIFAQSLAFIAIGFRIGAVAAVGIFVVGLIYIFVHNHRIARAISWRKFFSIYTLSGSIAVIAFFLTALIKQLQWAHVFLIVTPLLLVSEYLSSKSGQNQEQIADTLYRFERGLIDRESARDSLLATSMKPKEIESTLNMVEKRQIIERHIDGELDSSQVTKALLDLGMWQTDVEDYKRNQIRAAIAMRYTKQEIGRAEARKLLTDLGKLSYEKTVNLLDGIDHQRA